MTTIRTLTLIAVAATFPLFAGCGGSGAGIEAPAADFATPDAPETSPEMSTDAPADAAEAGADPSADGTEPMGRGRDVVIRVDAIGSRLDPTWVWGVMDVNLTRRTVRANPLIVYDSQAARQAREGVYYFWLDQDPANQAAFPNAKRVVYRGLASQGRYVNRRTLKIKGTAVVTIDDRGKRGDQVSIQFTPFPTDRNAAHAQRTMNYRLTASDFEFRRL